MNLSIFDFSIFNRKEKIFLGVSAFIALATAVGSSVFLWVKTEEGAKIPKTTPPSNPFANIPRPSASQPPSASVSPPTSQETGPVFAQFTDPEDGLSFLYPNWMQAFKYFPDYGLKAWTLQDANSNILVEISITNKPLDYFQTKYPRLNFTPFEQTGASGWSTSYFTPGKSDGAIFYYLEGDINEGNVWVTAWLDNFAKEQNLSRLEKEEIVNKIIASFNRPS